MSIKYNIGGSATINGVIMINAYKGKAVRAIRDSKGGISVHGIPIFNRAMGFYKRNMEKAVSRVPVLRELFKILLMLLIAVSSPILEIKQMTSNKRGWSMRRCVSLALLMLSLYVLLFLDYYFTIPMLIVLIVNFHQEISLILKYHGAEHKCINMYEGIDDISSVSIENIRTFSRTHVRCGTNMVLVLLPISLAYLLIMENYLMTIAVGSILDLLLSIILIGISIEVFKLFQKPIMRWMLKPGILLQKYITTKEPEDSQLEVAFIALKAVVND